MSSGLDRQAQIDLILDHYQSPRCFGRLDDASAVGEAYNPGCGDTATVYLKHDEDGRISAVRFEGVGCTISQAAASMTMELTMAMCAGQPLAVVRSLTADAILDMVGRDLTATRVRCATLGLTALQMAVTRAGERQGQATPHDTPPPQGANQ